MTTQLKTFTLYRAEPDPVVKAIREIGQLPAGWDFGEGVPAPKLVVREALEVYSLATLAGVAVEPNPQTNGGIWLTLAFESVFPKYQNFLNISVNPDLTLDMRHERGFGADYDLINEQENVDKATIYRAINALENNPAWNLSEHFISENSTPNLAVSKATVSKNTVREYPSFTPNAPLRPLVAFAHT